MEKILTISIAAYNVEQYIRQALDSICSCQSILTDIEVLVIDDGGNDNTYRIAKVYEKKYPDTVIAVHKENNGWGSTVNYAVSHARGKYLRLVDGDDHVDTDGLAELVRILKHCDADAVFSPFYRFDDRSGKRLKLYTAHSSCPKGETISVHDVDSKNFVMHSLVFDVRVLREHGISCTENCFYTDAEYVTKGLAFVEKVFVTDIPIYMYRTNREDQSISIKGVIRHCDDACRVAEELMRFSRMNISSHNIEIVVKKTVSSIIYAYRGIVLSENRKKLQNFDETVRKYENHFYQINNGMIQRLRKNNFKNIKIEAYRYKIQLALSKVVHNLSLLSD